MSPSEALRELQKAGIAPSLDVATFERICRERLEDQRLKEKSDDEESYDDDDWSERMKRIDVDGALALAALFAHYGEGPTPQATADQLMLLTYANSATELVAPLSNQVRHQLSAWSGARVPDLTQFRDVEDALSNVGDILFRTSGWEGPLLYSIEEEWLDSWIRLIAKRVKLSFSLFDTVSCHVSPDVEAARSGIHRGGGILSIGSYQLHLPEFWYDTERTIRQKPDFFGYNGTAMPGVSFAFNVLVDGAGDREQRERLVSAYVAGHRSPNYTNSQVVIEGANFEVHQFDGSVSAGLDISYELYVGESFGDLLSFGFGIKTTSPERESIRFLLTTMVGNAIVRRGYALHRE